MVRMDWCEPTPTDPSKLSTPFTLDDVSTKHGSAILDFKDVDRKHSDHPFALASLSTSPRRLLTSIAALSFLPGMAQITTI